VLHLTRARAPVPDRAGPVLQSFAIYFPVGNLPNEWKWSYFLMAATHLAILGIAAGRILGVDQMLRPRVTSSSILARAYRLAS